MVVVFDLYTLYHLWYLWLHATGMNLLKIRFVISGSISTTHGCSAICRCLCLEAHVLYNSESLYIDMVSSFLPLQICLIFCARYIIYSINCMSYFLYRKFMNTIWVLHSGQYSKRTIALIFQLQSFMSVWVFCAHVVPGACSFILPAVNLKNSSICSFVLTLLVPDGWPVGCLYSHVCQATFWPPF